MGTNFTDIATTDSVTAAEINDRLDELDAAIVAGLGGVTLTNKSGGALAANDCVVVDTTNNEAVTTTTSAGNTNRPGIILAGGAANAEVTVTFLGECTVVVDGAGTRGQWIKTSTTAKRVTPTSTLDEGVFGILTANSVGGAGTTATAVILGQVITAPGTHNQAASTITSGQLALARGGTNADLSATGGTSQYLKQASAGAAITVGAIAAADLPAATDAAQGAVELATSVETETGTDTTRAVTPAGSAAAHYKKTEHLNVSTGAGDAGKPIKLDAGGKVDASMINPADVDHNSTSNLTTGDPHTQYQLKSVLTTKGDLYVMNNAGTITRIGVGSESQYLKVTSAAAVGMSWASLDAASGIPGSTIDAKGDLIVGTADDTYSRLAVGSNGQALFANSGQAVGMEWAYPLLDNIFINGCFRFWQRTTDDTGVTTTRKYVADRWAVTTGAGTLAHVQRSTTVRSGARSNYSLELNGAVSVTTVDIDQRIEAGMVGAYKRQVYFTCYVYNNTGAAFTPKLLVATPSAADNWASSTVRNGGGSGEDLQSCADSAWTMVYWTADISGYTNIDNGVGFSLRIPSGSLVASDTVRLAEMNLTQMPIPTPMITRSYEVEFNLCRRRLQYVGRCAGGSAIAAGTVGLHCNFAPQMAAAPTVTLTTTTPDIRSNYASTVTGSGSTISDVLADASGLSCTIGGFSGLTATQGCSLQTEGALKAEIEL